jgi:DeoR family transcriptional regulator, aga operon transcriptional repressor
MLKETRWKKIQEIVDTTGTVKVEELAATLGVSSMTIRRDLQAMFEQNMLERTHGGAMIARERNLLMQPPILMRLKEQSAEKKSIAQAVAQMIKHGETIYLAAGTTTYYVAMAIANRSGLSVVTNSLPVANLLVASQGIEVLVVGGFLRRSEYSLVGHFAESNLRDLHMDKVITGIGGLHPEYGLTNEYPQEMQMDRAYMRISDNVIVVADHTKIGRIATSRTADLAAIRTLVTDQLASPEILQKIRQLGVEVITVQDKYGK